MVDKIKPSVLLADVPTMISIYGSHLGIDSPNVYNSVDEIWLNDQYNCSILHKNFSLIRCIIESVNQADNCKHC